MNGDKIYSREFLSIDRIKGNKYCTNYVTIIEGRREIIGYIFDNEADAIAMRDLIASTLKE